MKIAVTTAQPELDSPVFADFSQTPWLLVVDVEKLTCLPVEHLPVPESDCELARSVLMHRCEAVITGNIDEKAFDILADHGVTRFRAFNMSAKEAIDAMEKRTLGLIRNPDGTDICSGDHHY
jgi:predicted Fe-Mo cluster-binding NifX family protein